LHDLPPAYLAKHMQALKLGGIVSGETGRGGGYVLARTPGEVSLLDIVEAIEGPNRLFRCTEIRRRGKFAPPQSALGGRCGIAAAFDRAEQALREQLMNTSIADLANPGLTSTDQAAARWLTRAGV